MKPPTMPTSTVGTGLSTHGEALSGVRPFRRSRAPRAILVTRLPQATTSAQPSTVFRWAWAAALSPSWLSDQAPMKAAGTPPTTRRRTSAQLTLPCTAWTVAPTGFMARALTRSLAMATRGSTLNRSTRAGVISAPPPIPAIPTARPPKKPAQARSQVEGWAGTVANRATGTATSCIDRT